MRRRGGPMDCRHLCRIAVLFAGMIAAGCASTDRSLELTKERVTPITVGDAAHVPAEALAAAMLHAGLPRELILRDGPQVRNALATSGGARIRSGDTVEAMFAVHGDRLYVTSRSRGTTVQPLQSREHYASSRLPH